jgi:hypothetical protein
MLLHNAPEPKTAKNSLHLVLVTDHYDEETERLTGLGARPLNETKLPAVRWDHVRRPRGQRVRSGDMAARVVAESAH